MPQQYAAKTTVTPRRSRDEIQATLEAHGCTSFAWRTEEHVIWIGFEMGGHSIRYGLPLPDKNDRKFRYTPANRTRSAAESKKAYDQEVASRWRALAASIKGKLVSIEAGITTLEREFFADIILENRQTAYEWMAPQLRAGGMPLLPPGRNHDG